MSTVTIRRRLACRLPVVAAILLVAVGNSAQAEITQKHRDLSDEVFKRLLRVIPRPDKWEVWPPTLELVDSDVCNASAGYKIVDDKRVPCITLNRGEIEIVAEFDPDMLAYTLGHELAHLTLYHAFEREGVLKDQDGKTTPLVILAMTRENESEADLTGVEYALRANFTRKGAKRNMLNSLRNNKYCGLKALGGSHPSWDERIAHVESDESQRRLWRSMTAFENGVFLLQTQQFAHAVVCFDRVTKEFPECYEAWANLGYARLMFYCDALEPEDLETFDIGQLVVGGFYDRPATMQALVRGIDEKLWFDAVGALREAIRIGGSSANKDPMLLAKANLAVAYLVHPAGKDIGEAERLFSEVMELLDDPQAAATVNPVTRASILLNASAGRDVAARLEQALQQIAKIEDALGAKSGAVAELTAAARYQQASALMKSVSAGDQSKACDLLESYLASSRTSNAWWPLAYDRYAKLAQAVGRTPKAKESFAGNKSKKWRTTTQVPITADLVVSIGDQTAEVVKKLGEAEAIVPVVKGTNLNLYKYSKRGLTLLAGSTIVAVFLDAEAAPALSLKRPEISGGSATIKVGMPRAELEKLLGDEWDATPGVLHDAALSYQIYRAAGLAVRFKGDVVTEIAVIVNSQS